MMMTSKETYNTYLENLIEGNRHQCSKIINELLDGGTDVKTVYNDIFRDSLYEIGRKWERNEISVAVEHMATSITESLMNLVYPYLFSQEHKNRKAIISSAVNEYHQIGGRMVADIIEMNGWDSYYLGANTPLTELLRMIEEKKPDVVGLSVSMYYNLYRLSDYISSIQQQFPFVDVIVGGHAFMNGAEQLLSNHNGVVHLKGLEDLERYLKQQYAE